MGNEWKDYLTSRQAAIRLGLSPQRVSQFLHQGRIPFKVRGNCCMIKLSDLEKFASIERPACRPRPSPWDD
jgi:excisionase family DNA binding protein